MAARRSGGRAPRTHIVSDLVCVRVGSRRSCVCLPAGLCSREIVGHAAGGHKDASLVKPAFAMAAFPLTDIQALHADRGSESGSIAIDGLLGAFGIGRSLSRKGCPYGNAAGEQDAEGRVRLQGELPGAARLQARLNDYVHWHNHFRLHSKPGYVSPAEFRNAGLNL